MHFVILHALGVKFGALLSSHGHHVVRHGSNLAMQHGHHAIRHGANQAINGLNSGAVSTMHQVAMSNVLNVPTDPNLLTQTVKSAFGLSGASANDITLAGLRKGAEMQKFLSSLGVDPQTAAQVMSNIVSGSTL